MTHRNIVWAGLLALAPGAGAGAAIDDPKGYVPSLVVGRDGLPVLAHCIESGSGLRVITCGMASCQ